MDLEKEKTILQYGQDNGFDEDDMFSLAAEDIVAQSESEMSAENTELRSRWPQYIVVERSNSQEHVKTMIRRVLDTIPGASYSIEWYEKVSELKEDNMYELFNEPENKYSHNDYMGFEIKHMTPGLIISLCHIINYIGNRYLSTIHLTKCNHNYRKLIITTLQYYLDIPESKAQIIIKKHNEEEFILCGYGRIIVNHFMTLQSNMNYRRLMSSCSLEGFELKEFPKKMNTLTANIEQIRNWVRSPNDYDFYMVPGRNGKYLFKYIETADVFLEGSRMTIFLEMEHQFPEDNTYGAIYEKSPEINWISFVCLDKEELYENLKHIVGDKYVQIPYQQIMTEVKQFKREKWI